jgi:hypothetical protein
VPSLGGCVVAETDTEPTVDTRSRPSVTAAAASTRSFKLGSFELLE